MFKSILVPMALVATTPAAAQYSTARSSDYLLATSDGDVRTTWANPASLAIIPDASVMAEFRVDTPEGESAHLGQVTVGLSTRGLSIVYQRDRFLNDSTGHTWRFSLAVPVQTGSPTSIGAALNLYRGAGDGQQGLDIGVRHAGFRPLDLAIVLRHVGRPVVRSVPLPLTGVGSATWRIGPLFELGGELAYMESRDEFMLDSQLNYRGLLRINLASLGATGIATVHMRDGLEVDRVLFGISLGTNRRVIGLGSVDTFDDTRFNGISVTGLATETPR